MVAFEKPLKELLLKEYVTIMMIKTHLSIRLLQRCSDFSSLVPRILSQTLVPVAQFFCLDADLFTSCQRTQLRAIVTQVIHQRPLLTQQLRHRLSTESLPMSLFSGFQSPYAI